MDVTSFAFLLDHFPVVLGEIQVVLSHIALLILRIILFWQLCRLLKALSPLLDPEDFEDKLGTLRLLRVTGPNFSCSARTNEER